MMFNVLYKKNLLFAENAKKTKLRYMTSVVAITGGGVDIGVLDPINFEIGLSGNHLILSFMQFILPRFIYIKEFC